MTDAKSSRDPANELPEVELKNPALAALLAWFVPGLGHLYQGRISKGLLFMLCILPTFLAGVVMGSSPEVGWGRVVYLGWPPNGAPEIRQRLPYLCQIGAGAVALPALYQARRVHQGDPNVGTFMAPPRPGELDELHRSLGRWFELGTVYTMIAGLLNLLAIYDAWGGPVFMIEEKKDPEKPKPDAPQDDPPPDGNGASREESA